MSASLLAVMSLWEICFLNTLQQHWMKLKTHKKLLLREDGSRMYGCIWCCFCSRLLSLGESAQCKWMKRVRSKVEGKLVSLGWDIYHFAQSCYAFTCNAMRCWQHKKNIFMVLSFTLCFMQIIYVMINSLSQLFRGKLKVIRHLLLCAALPSNILLFIAPE